MSPKNVSITALDAAEGIEKDIIIFAAAPSTSSVQNQKRQFYALSRAKHSLIIVGQIAELQQDYWWSKLLRAAVAKGVVHEVDLAQNTLSLSELLN